MTNVISYEVQRIDSGNGLQNTYSLSFESPLGMIENVQFRASEENVIQEAIKCLGSNLSVLADLKIQGN